MSFFYAFLHLFITQSFQKKPHLSFITEKNVLQRVQEHVCVIMLMMAMMIKANNVFYLFLRKRQSVSRGGADREGDTDSEAGSRL